MYKTKLLCFFLLSFSIVGSAQKIRCGTELNLYKLRINAPESYARFMALEKHTQDYIKSVKDGANLEILSNPNATIIIPVVVHVLDNGNPIGVGGNLSVAQIQSQIDVLNEDFRKLNSNSVNTPSAFQPVAADVNFEFRLACVDPNGNVTNGITRTLTNVSTFYPLLHQNIDGSFDEIALGIKYTALGGKDAWPTNKYLNIWLCNMDKVLGYTQKVSDYSVKPNTDGIVIERSAFGRIGTVSFPFDKGRTASHEIGHWLNLLHLWGDAVCGNDFVDDTPQQQTYNFNCPSFPHLSNCTNNGSNGDMFMNFMDYTWDNCMTLFSEGQKLRMRAVFASGGPRTSFIDNYFHINAFNVGNGFCVGNLLNITATNLICMPTAWSLTGPAVIAGGQGTNQVTIQATGNGLITITGAAGGYTDSKTFTAGPPTEPVQILGIPDNYGMCRNQVFNVTTDRAGNFTWTVIAGQILSGQGTPEIYIKLGNSPGGFYIGVAQSNTCGLSSVLGTKQGTILDCDSDGEVASKIVINPNPTSGELQISIKDPAKSIKEIQISDKLGNVKKRFIYSYNVQSIKINIAELPTDVYIIQVYDGNNWISNKIIKQ